MVAISSSDWSSTSLRITTLRCRVGSATNLDSAVSIHSVERFLGDLALERGWSFDAPLVPTGRRVLGLTSAKNAPFVRSLGLYDAVVTYGSEVSALGEDRGDTDERWIYIDVAGNDERLSCDQGHALQLRGRVFLFRSGFFAGFLFRFFVGLFLFSFLLFNFGRRRIDLSGGDIRQNRCVGYSSQVGSCGGGCSGGRVSDCLLCQKFRRKQYRKNQPIVVFHNSR